MCSFKTWTHIDLNWLFDIDLTSSLTFNSFVSFTFSLIIELNIKKSSNWLHRIILIRFRFSTSSRVLWHLQLQLWFVQSFNYESSKSYRKLAWKTAWKIFEKLLEKLLDERFSRFACIFHWRIEFMTKDTWNEHMKHTNSYAKNAYLKYSSSKLRFEKKKLCHDFNTSVNTHRFRWLERFEDRYHTFYII